MPAHVGAFLCHRDSCRLTEPDGGCSNCRASNEGRSLYSARAGSYIVAAAWTATGLPAARASMSRAPISRSARSALRRVAGRLEVAEQVTDVFVVAPIRVHRESLSVALNDTESVSVVGTAPTVPDALPHLRDVGADVAVLDAPTPDDVDLSLPTIIESEVKLVAVGVPDEEAVGWIEAGVSGCVPPEASLADLAGAVATVAGGELVTPPNVTGHLINRVRRLAAEVPGAAERGRLTSRQMQVLALADQGLTNQQIARRLSIQEQTVKNHMHRILQKLGVHRRAEAVARMRRRGRHSRGR
jgi:two-component system, NarL family, nitrate/nitrite response regulator NarL